MRKMMVLFAHPDDEGAIAGTLAHYARQNTEITLVCATKGEVGEISDPALATPGTLGTVREQELETACGILGIKHIEFMGYRDSGMAGTPENEDTRALVQANPEAVIGQIVGLMRQHQPDIVITFEPFGWYGHPDHQAVSRWATAAYAQAGDKNAYPDQGPAWLAQRLFHAVIPFSKFQGMMQEAAASGYIEDGGPGVDIPQEQQLQTEAAVTHVININGVFDVKRQAMFAHRTQFAADSFFRKIPVEMMRKVSGQEYFIQVSPEPAPAQTQDRAADLFL